MSSGERSNSATNAFIHLGGGECIYAKKAQATGARAERRICAQCAASSMNGVCSVGTAYTQQLFYGRPRKKTNATAAVAASHEEKIKSRKSTQEGSERK